LGITAGLPDFTGRGFSRERACFRGTGVSTLRARMTPYGRALLHYHKNAIDSEFVLRRDDGFAAKISAASFFDDSQFPVLEQRALDLCHGKVLDIGAGAGRHALALQRMGLEVCAVDILPEAVFVMRERGVREALPHDVMSLEARTFDTLLMLMNGIGLVGTPSELDRFLSHAAHLINPGGCLLCDSIDVAKTTDPIHVRYREKNVRKNRYPGQQFYTASYNHEESALFPWLHIEFPMLAAHAKRNGWAAELILAEDDGHYLAKLTVI
jgi:2-polyprenyl-3-methyl-5-hydroxy-6-metoxy-1,4-benzoquinol methylase